MIKKYVRNSSYSKDDSSFLSNASGYTMKGTIEKSGWLQKWTNYLKGYRDRWFVLDSDGYISYYRFLSFLDPEITQFFVETNLKLEWFVVVHLTYRKLVFIRRPILHWCVIIF